MSMDEVRLTPEILAHGAYKSLMTFQETGCCYWGDNTDEKIQDLVSALRHLADSTGAKWEQILRNADRLYQGDLGIENIDPTSRKPK